MIDGSGSIHQDDHLTTDIEADNPKSKYSLEYDIHTESFLLPDTKDETDLTTTSSIGLKHRVREEINKRINLWKDFIVENLFLVKQRTFKQNFFVFVDRCDEFWYKQISESTYVFLFVIGVINALVYFCFDEALEFLLTRKYLYFQEQRNTGAASFFISYLSFHWLAAMLAVYLTSIISPVAVGSGIPHMKSVLAGFEIPGLLDIKTLVAKIVGLYLGLLAAFVIGTEGPFLHISCIIAFNVAKLLPGFKQIADTPALMKQALSAASAVGVTSAFGSPIGGVLYSIEVTSNFYNLEDYWKGFFSSVCSALTFKELSYFGSTRNSVVALFATDFGPLPYLFTELPFFIGLSILSGLAGGLFIKLFETISSFYRKIDREVFIAGKMRKLSNPYSFATFVLFCTLLLNLIGGDLMFLPFRTVISDLFTSGDLKDKYTTGNWENPSLILNLITFFCFKFVLGAASISLSIPLGIFTPTFMIGASLGRAVGEFMRYFYGHTIAGGYALVGAASFSAAVTGTVSSAVIVFELTSELSYMLPVLLAVLIGKFTASLVSSKYIYDSLATLRKLPTLPKLSLRAGYVMQVRQFMTFNNIPMIPRFLDLADTTSFQDLLRSSKDSKEDIAIVDSLGNPFYFGSINSRWLRRIIAEHQSGKIESTFDLLSLVDADQSVPKIRASDSIYDLLRLSFGTDQRQNFFVTDHGRVVGTISLSRISEAIRLGIL